MNDSPQGPALSSKLSAPHEHDKAEVIRRAFDDLAEGKSTFFDLLSDDLVYHGTDLGGGMVTMDKQRLLSIGTALHEATDDIRREFEVSGIGDSLVIAKARSIQSAGDLAVNSHFVMVLRFEGDKVTYGCDLSDWPLVRYLEELSDRIGSK